MANGKVIGVIQVTKGDIKVIGVDGSVREPAYNGYMYENEQIISSDPSALFQIKFLALPEASAYDGIFRILADGSVIHGRDAMDSIASDENLQNIIETAAAEEAVAEKAAEVETAGEDLETAAGEGEAEAGSHYTPPNIVAESSVLGFNRGANGELGLGITEFGSEQNYDPSQINPPVITSPNIAIYDENDTVPVLQVTAEGQSAIGYSISGLDSDHFNIDPQSGLITFVESPDFENALDGDGDNEYNLYVTATDEQGNYTTQLVSVSINNVNEPVTAYDDVVNAVEDTILSSTIDLDANDYDVDGDELSVAAGTFATAQGGEIAINADGSYVYTPPANFNGVDSVDYTVTDGEFSDTATLTINVAPVNDAPVAVDDTVNALEDTVLNSAIELDANDYDVDGDTLSVVAGTFATQAGGEIVIASDGSYVYTPAANFNGVDSVEYTVTDGEMSDVGKLTINVAPVNDVPPPPPPPPVNEETVVNADNAVTDEDTPVTIDVLANDTDAEGNISPVASVTQGTNGTVVLNEDGTVTYTPNANFNGNDSFSYTNAEGNSATVSVTVNPLNDLTVVNADNAVTDEDTPVTIDVLANDTDVDGVKSPVASVTQGTDGTVVLNEDGTVTYTPNADFSGSDSFSYTNAEGNSATVNVTVNPLGDETVVNPDSATTDEDTPVTIDVLANDTDAEGVKSPVASVTDGSNGTVVLNGDGTVTYTPNANFNGSDSFTYTNAEGNSATVSVSVGPVADAPIVVVDPDIENPVVEQDYEEATFTNYNPQINSGSDTGILEFDNYAKSVSMSIKSFDGREGKDLGKVELIRDGDVIKTYSLNDYFTGTPGESTNQVLVFESDVYFNEVRVSNTSTNDQFKVEDVSLVSPYLVTYNIDISASLTDSSETLSDVILKVPASLDGVLVVGGFAPVGALSADGSYNYYSIPSSTESVQMKFDFPEELSEAQIDALESELSSISGSATSWASGDGYALSATSGDDIIAGTADGDEILGDEGDDVIFGGAGTDTLNGDEGSDTLSGDEGDDTILGGSGSDAIYGGAGSDTIGGGEGDDYIDGGAGADTIDGGAGNDTIAYDAADTITGGAGDDTLIGNSEVINLSNVSNMEVIELNSGTSVIGSGADGGINASDVLSAGSGGVLIIQSADGSSLNSVNVDTASLTQGANENIGGIDYAAYSNGSATLYIELDDSIDVI